MWGRDRSAFRKWKIESSVVISSLINSQSLSWHRKPSTYTLAQLKAYNMAPCTYPLNCHHTHRHTHAETAEKESLVMVFGFVISIISDVERQVRGVWVWKAQVDREPMCTCTHWHALDLWSRTWSALALWQKNAEALENRVSWESNHSTMSAQWQASELIAIQAIYSFDWLTQNGCWAVIEFRPVWRPDNVRMQ